MKTRIKLVRMAALSLTLVGAALMMAQQGARRNDPPPRPKGPCDIYAAAGDACVAAHSTTRALYASYNGPLYQVLRQSDGKTLDVGVVQPVASPVPDASGYANAAAQDAFCANTYCWVAKIYDQSPKHNDLIQAPRGGFSGPAMGGFNNLPVADMAPITIMGHKAYGVLLEPIPANGLTDSAVQATVKKEYFPNQFTVIPHDGDKVTVGDAQLTWHAVDTKLYNVNLYHFAHALGKPTSDVLFWAVTIVNCPQEIPRVRLAIGSNAASVWWVNGKEVIGIYGDRQTVIDDGVSKRLTLHKGPNVLRAAIINGGGATDFCARFLDAEDKPLKGYTICVSEVHR